MSPAWRRLLSVVAVLALSGTASVLAQSQSGNLFGTCVDDAGAVLPGVTVTLTGGGAPQAQVTGAQGEARFLGLAPGSYALSAALEGFSTVEYPSIVIGVNRNTTIRITLAPAVEETITVTTESPLIDSRKISTGTTMTEIELEKVPTARDPWALLQTVPGVQTDRVNVGGSESGNQAQFTGPGSTGGDAVWAIDGVVITDMAAIGSSPTYYNFDSFAEVQVTTGGSDASLASGGVTLNMVTKRGTNAWRGSARYIRADDNWQSGLDLAASEYGQDYDGPGPVRAQRSFKQGNRIVYVEDYGVEAGGPLVNDKLWIWGHYGKNGIDLLTIDDVSAVTSLEEYGAKLNAQLTPASSLVGFYNFGDKVVNGLNAGPTRPQETTWNQSGPVDISKLEGTHVFSPSFFLTGLVSYVGGGFVFTPQGGLDGPPPALDEDFIWHNNFFHHDTDRPQDQVKVDGDFFFDTGAVAHDLKFGVGYRRVKIESETLYPGNGARYDFYQVFGYAYNVFAASRQTLNRGESTYESLYAQDTLTKGNLTANVGVRYDNQDGKIDEMTARGVPGFETLDDGSPLLPAVTVEGYDQPFLWEDVSPRLGLTYALSQDRRTLLRASFSRFAQQLRQAYTTYTAPLSAGVYTYAFFYYEDLNGDEYVTPDEVIGLDYPGPLPTCSTSFSYPCTNGYDPLGQTSPNRLDPNFNTPVTDELILGVEHALRPELVIGATLTLRNVWDIVEVERLVVDETGTIRPHVRADYVLRNTATVIRPDGSTFDTEIWGLRGGVEDTGGSYLTNGDREQDYQGLSLTVNKRLANRWMLRGHVSLQDWTWDVPEDERENPSIGLGGDYDDGGPVVQGSSFGGGAKGGVYISAGWSYSLTGLYQVAPERKWGFNVAAAAHGHEGYAIPYFQRVTGLFATSVQVQATSAADEFTLPDVHVVDFRLEKDFRVNDLTVTVAAELFNALNESTVLQRQHRLGTGTSDHVLEVLSPRVWRFGVRLRFR